jgi:hypothetical protein
MTFSLGQSLLDLPQNSARRVALSFEKAQAVPKTDDFSLFRGIYGVLLTNMPNVNEKRTNGKPLGIGAIADEAHN